jgi:transposase
MGAKQSQAVKNCLAKINEGMTAYRAAKEEGVSIAHIYKVIAKLKKGKKLWTLKN